MFLIEDEDQDKTQLKFLYIISFVMLFENKFLLSHVSNQNFDFFIDFVY